MAVLVVSALMLVGCNKKEEVKTLRLFNGKIEIDEPLKEYAKSYEEKTGVKVEIESIGGGADIGATLKGYLAAGNMPDIFVLGGEGDYNSWKEYLEDLSDSDWAKDTDVAYKSEDGKTVGFPYAIEGYGLTYNKDLLDKAGIDPKTLINYDAYQKAFEKLDSMKEELGIDAVVSISAESGGMWWSTGNHDFGTYLGTGLEVGDTTYIDMLKNGDVDDARLTQYGEFVNLMFNYADKQVLLSGTYDDQLALWATGKAVFVHQGNWIDPSLSTYDATFDMGISPLAFMHEDTDGILADAPSWWSVYNGGESIDDSKAFLNSLAETEEGENCLVNNCGMISPFKSAVVTPKLPLAKNVASWVAAGKTYSWQWAKIPEGFSQNNLGPCFSALASDDVDVDGFVSLIKNAIATLK
jgi:raffinose/stachyose/melibiose transport system substrate-binding protein